MQSNPLLRNIQGYIYNNMIIQYKNWKIQYFHISIHRDITIHFE